MKENPLVLLVDAMFTAAKIGLLIVGVAMGASAAVVMLTVSFKMAWKAVS